MKMRKQVAPFVLLTVLVGGARAQIVFNNTDGAERTSYVWTVTDLNNTNPTVSTGNGTASNTLTGAGSFLAGESFTLTASGRYGWNTESARAATNNFATYFAGLSVGGVGAMADGDFGVDSPSNAAIPVEHALEGTIEVLIFTADTSGLSAGSTLSFQGVLFEIYDDFARTDFLVYDASANKVVAAQWNHFFTGSSFSGNWTLDDGDMVLIATASDNTSTKWRVAEFTLDVTAGVPDTDPPTPNPATWASAPASIGPVAIRMTATTGVDDHAVEYYFDETSGNPGGADSGWQSDSSYTNSGLNPLTEYSYTVQMRDTAGNTGTVSAVAYATTDAPDTAAPTPNPATWASAPTNNGPFAVGMTATTGSDDNGVEYYFDETSGNPGGADSGWQSDSSYTNSGLFPDTQYSYTVQMRDSLGNTGTVSGVAYAATPAVVGRTGGPPNVIIIYADDLGYADIGHNATNPIVHTPAIDRICNQGIYLNNYMTHQVCSPSRAGLLTGRHHTEVGFGAQTGGTLDNSIPNIAKDFKASGYKTACFGKWHNSFAPETDDGNWEVVPSLAAIDPYDGVLQLTADETNFGEGVNAYGFDEWQGFYGGGHSYHNRINAREFDWWVNYRWSPDVTGYNTYLIRDAALDFIDQNATNAFFLYIPHECVHGPYEILNTDLEEMCNIVDDVRPDLAWSIVGELQSPSTGRKVKDVLQLYCNSGDPYDPAWGFEREFDKAVMDGIHPGFDNLIYYTMIYAMDKSTRDILDRLDAYGLTTNTIVVFTADNGGTLSGDNYPFRGFKHMLYEGGVHVAAAILWPGTLDADTAPYTPADNVYTNLTQYFDWYPTLVNMAGQTVTAAELDGINLTPHLLNRTPVRTGYSNSFYNVDDQHAAIRTQRWKLHFNRVPGDSQMLELYDLYNDIGETNNVQAVYPSERDQLISMMDDWFSSGDVTASYYPLLGSVIPAYLEPAPEGDILEITATQTNPITNLRNESVYVRYSAPDWAPDVYPYDAYAHAGDIFQYDIYVAEDSDHISGFYCSPSTGPTPRYDNTRGIDLDGKLLREQILPKGRWVRRVCGMGEVAPNTSFASFVALQNPNPGYYHFYIDNVVIRKNDGTIRGVTWSEASDWTTTRFWQGGKTYQTLADLPNQTYSDISLKVVDLSTLPVSTNAGASYSTWAEAIGGLEGYALSDPGPTNAWPLYMEYALGRDPFTETAGLLKGDDAPTSGELGTYTFKTLPVNNLYQDYMTMTFDFNRAARNVEIVVAESSNLVDWVDSVVLNPPYSDAGILALNEQIVSVQDNPDGYPVDTTRVTARSRMAMDDISKGFLKLEVRPIDATIPNTPADLIASVHNGVVLEWSGSSNTDEYIIERAVSGSGSFAEIRRTDVQHHTDTSAASGQTYDYRVGAVNDLGQSVWSATVTITR